MKTLATFAEFRYVPQRMISEHASEWLGLPVKLYKPDETPDYARNIYRLATDWDGKMTFTELFEKFTSDPACAASKAIVIGAFHGDDPGQGCEDVVNMLVTAKPLLPNLRGIFIGDILSEENEISWIILSDITPIFEAYPELEHFRIRGSEELSIGGGIHHAKLKSLVFESGGLPAQIVREIGASKLPELEHLEIWTGSDNYLGDSTVEDLRQILDARAWPKLRRLGLRDSEYADDIAEALIGALVLEKLDELDLSLGVLSDRGGEALLKNSILRRLKNLNLHYHYLSEEMTEKLAAAYPKADLSDPQGDGDEDDRYIAVSE